jgi:hypothetical protein
MIGFLKLSEFLTAITFVLSYLKFGDSIATRETIIKDWALCNNGYESENPFMGKTCDDGPCDTRQINDKNCIGWNLLVDHSNLNQLDHIFHQMDGNVSVRRLILHFPNSVHQLLSSKIDRLLTPRVWLFIRDETFVWESIKSQYIIIDKYHHHYENYLRSIAYTQYPPLSICNSTIIMVNRVKFIHPGWAGCLGIIFREYTEYPYAITYMYVTESNDMNHTVTAYISPEDCLTTINKWLCTFLTTTNCSLPKPIGNCKNNYCVESWPETDNFGAYFINHQYLHRKNNKLLTEYHNKIKQPLSSLQQLYHTYTTSFIPFTTIQPDIFTIHNNRTHTNDSNQFNRMNMGVDETLWEFHFLLRMNHNYRSYVYREYSKYHQIQDLLYQSNNNPNNNDNNNNNHDVSNLMKNSKNTMINYEYNPSHISHIQLQSQLHPHHHLQDYHPTNTSSSSSAEYPLLSHRRCIAAHIRRGDRLGPLHQNITDYCLTHREGDFGCETIPFQTIRLEDYIDIAQIMMNTTTSNNNKNNNNNNNNKLTIKHLFVACDDEEWLQTEILLMNRKYPDWRISYLPFFNYSVMNNNNINNNNNNNNQNEDYSHEHQLLVSSSYLEGNDNFALRRGTNAGIHFLVTQLLLQDCEGFIGHFASGTSWHFYRSMCHMHASKHIQGICPPSYDVRQGFDWFKSKER